MPVPKQSKDQLRGLADKKQWIAPEVRVFTVNFEWQRGLDVGPFPRS